MTLTQAYGARGRDYFQFDVPQLALERAVEGSTASWRSSRGLVLNLQQEEATAREIRVEGMAIPILPFPRATRSLAELTLDPRPYGPGEDDVTLYLPRAAFDRLADEHGVDRISDLALAPGVAVGDEVMSNLAACLNHAFAPTRANPTIVGQVTAALTTHVAQRYGGMGAPVPLRSGGLSPWQLRLARNTFDQHLDGSFSIDALARDCGLSASHFARAFTRSTGLAPHRWLMQRRIEAAKELILMGAPLAQIAPDCGFSDQSHLSRTFAKVTGLPPGRWRAAQEEAVGTEGLDRATG